MSPPTQNLSLFCDKFLDLPTEVRLMIYERALSHPQLQYNNNFPALPEALRNNKKLGKDFFKYGYQEMKHITFECDDPR
jgi:hypothetical protein